MCPWIRRGKEKKRRELWPTISGLNYRTSFPWNITGNNYPRFRIVSPVCVRDSFKIETDDVLMWSVDAYIFEKWVENSFSKLEKIIFFLNILQRKREINFFLSLNRTLIRFDFASNSPWIQVCNWIGGGF